MAGLLLYGDDLAVFIELHDAEPFRIADVVAENGGKPLVCLQHSIPEHLTHAGAVKDVVT